MSLSQKKLLLFIIGIGIISGSIRVLIDYVFRYIDSSPIMYYSTFLIAFIAEIIIIIWAIKKYKNTKGTLTIIDAVKTGVIIMGSIGLFYCTMAFVYDTYIDPDFQTTMTIRFTEQFSPEQLAQVKENIKNQNAAQSYIGVIMYTIWFVFLGAVISLIAGAVLKTKEDIK